MQDGPPTVTVRYDTPTSNEIYEGRDSIEAALVIGKGPRSVEVVYRIGDEN
jgi:hypothetical protein